MHQDPIEVKTDLIKLLFVYINVTFIIVAGFYVLYQVSTRTDIPQGSQVTSFAALVGGFVGICVQFLTGSEIATRATRSATSSFQTGATTSTPNTLTATSTPNTASVTATPNVLSTTPPPPPPADGV